MLPVNIAVAERLESDPPSINVGVNLQNTITHSTKKQYFENLLFISPSPSCPHLEPKKVGIGSGKDRHYSLKPQPNTIPVDTSARAWEKAADIATTDCDRAGKHRFQFNQMKL